MADAQGPLHTSSSLSESIPAEGPLLATKLWVPGIPSGLLSRPRLTDPLNARPGGGVTLLSAPAGFGKTTLLVDWIRRQHGPAAWLTLDEHDNDPVLFWRYVIAALQTVDGRIGAQAQATLAAGASVPLERAITLLINDIAALAAPDDPLLLVLDDFHWIHTARIHQSLNNLLMHQPPQLHIVLSTRADPALSLARLRVAGRLLELRATDLLLTPPEMAAYLSQVMNLDVSEEALGLLAEQTEGWVAGLHLAALSLRQHGGARAAGLLRTVAGAKRHVFSYLIDEVLHHQSARLRRFLRQTAVLDQFCGSLCTAVTGRADAPHILRQLSADHLFITPLDEEGQWYRYHPLFADMLRANLDEDAARACHRRAARWFAGQQRTQDAIRHALAAQDYGLMAGFLTQSYKHFLVHGLLASLKKWLAALPADYQTPRLRLAAAWCRVYESNESELQQLLSTMVDQPAQMADSFQGEILAVRAVYASLYGQPDQGIQWAAQALRLIDPADFLSRAAAYQGMGNAYRALGELDAALAAYAQARRQFQALDNPAMGQLPLFRMIGIQVMQGRLVQALQSYETIAKQDTADGTEPLLVSGEIFGHLSDLYWERNELDQAHAYARQEVELAELDHMLLTLVDGYLRLSQVSATQGDGDAARHALDLAADTAAQLPSAPVSAQVAMCRARHHLARGDLAAAAAWADDYAEQQGRGTCALTPLQSQSADLLLARIRLAQGQLSTALELLQNAIYHCEANGRVRLVAEANVLQALALAERRESAAAQKALIRALTLAKREGYVRLFLENGEAIVPLLKQVQHLFPDFVSHLRSALPGGPTANTQAPRLVDPLTVREQDILNLIAQGQSNRQIADALCITVGTVKGHVNHILGKLGAQSRTQALVLARRLNLLDS